jgi:hypothetical protein
MNGEQTETLFKVKTVAGETYGPAPRSEIAAWAADGRISPEDMITPDGGEPQHASTVDWICDALASRTPPRHQSEVDRSGNAPNALEHIIPTGNAPAIAAWYLGVFGLIPVLGLPLAVAAIAMGIMGLKRASEVKVGLWHSILGVFLGVIVLFITALVLFGAMDQI